MVTITAMASKKVESTSYSNDVKKAAKRVRNDVKALSKVLGVKKDDIIKHVKEADIDLSSAETLITSRSNFQNNFLDQVLENKELSDKASKKVESLLNSIFSNLKVLTENDALPLLERGQKISKVVKVIIIGLLLAYPAYKTGQAVIEKWNPQNPKKDTQQVVPAQSDDQDKDSANTVNYQDLINQQGNQYNPEDGKLKNKNNPEGEPPQYQTLNFALVNGRVMPKASADKTLAETCKRVNYFKILREGLADVFVQIASNSQLTDLQKEYFVRRMINAYNGQEMDESPNTDNGKLFFKLYGPEYQNALRLGKIKNTIELNYMTGVQSKTAVFKEFVTRINWQSKTVNPPLKEYEKYRLSHDLFFIVAPEDWENRDFTNINAMIDPNDISKLDDQTKTAFTLLLGGGEWGNTFEAVVTHTVEVNSDPDYEGDSPNMNLNDLDF